MGLNHSCVSSSKKKKASHIHDSSYQGFVNNLPGDLTTRCNYDQGDMPSASSPPVKRLANTKTRLSSSSEKNDNLAYSYNSLSQSRSVFVKDENHSKSGQIQNSTSCSTNDVRSLRNAGDNECYNPKFTSLAPEEHLMSSNIESDNGISLLGNRPSLTIKVINTNEGRQVHVLRRGSLSGIHTFAKEISLGDQALSRQGDSIGFLSANSRHTQSDTITILRPSTCALGHESKQRRRIMMSNLQGKSNKTVACTRRALSGKAERCFTQQALDSSEYSPVPILCIDKENQIYVCDIGLSNEQCDEIIETAEASSNGSYAAYTYAKQTIGCRDHDELADTCEVPVLIACATIRHHFGPQKLALDDREPHVVKYDISKKERQKLDMHTDKSEWTFLISLSEAKADFCGGGTFFEDLEATVHLQRGQAILFPGKLRHRGEKITRGTRFLLVGFMVNKFDQSCTHRDES